MFTQGDDLWSALGRRRPKSAGSCSRKDAEPPQAIGSHATPGNDAGQSDGLAVLLLQGEQARPISPGISRDK
jgi:hypothetical protein